MNHDLKKEKKKKKKPTANSLAAMCAALRQLGLNPYHFSEVSKNNNNKHFQLWLKAVRAKYDRIGEPFRGEDFDQMLWDYDVCCFP